MKEHISNSLVNVPEEKYYDLVKEGWVEKARKEKEGKELTDEERDRAIGIRNVITEEFLLSLLRFPHLIVLPSKIFAYIFDKPFMKWDEFYKGKIQPKYSHFVFNIREKMVSRTQISYDKYKENQKDFW